MQTSKFRKDYVENTSEEGFRSALFLAIEFLPRVNSEVFIYINKESANSQHNLLSISKFMSELKVEYNINKKAQVKDHLHNNSTLNACQHPNSSVIHTSPIIGKGMGKVLDINKQTFMNHQNSNSYSPLTKLKPIHHYIDGINNCNNFSKQIVYQHKCLSQNSGHNQVLGVKVDNDYVRLHSEAERVHGKNSAEISRMINQPVTMNTMVYLHLLKKQHEITNEENSSIESPKKHKGATLKNRKLMASKPSAGRGCKVKNCTPKMSCRRCLRKRSILNQG